MLTCGPTVSGVVAGSRNFRPGVTKGTLSLDRLGDVRGCLGSVRRVQSRWYSLRLHRPHYLCLKVPLERHAMHHLHTLLGIHVTGARGGLSLLSLAMREFVMEVMTQNGRML